MTFRDDDEVAKVGDTIRLSYRLKGAKYRAGYVNSMEEYAGQEIVVKTCDGVIVQFEGWHWSPDMYTIVKRA